jgi:hypothetical protein
VLRLTVGQTLFGTWLIAQTCDAALWTLLQATLRRLLHLPHCVAVWKVRPRVHVHQLLTAWIQLAVIDLTELLCEQLWGTRPPPRLHADLLRARSASQLIRRRCAPPSVGLPCR